MGMKLTELRCKINQVDWRIKEVFKGLELESFFDIDYDIENPDQCFVACELSCLLSHLAYVHTSLAYLNNPIVHEGVIQVTDDGVYMLDGICLSCDYVIEIFVPGEIFESFTWLKTRIAEKDGVLYFVNRPDLPLEGVKARIR